MFKKLVFIVLENISSNSLIYKKLEYFKKTN